MKTVGVLKTKERSQRSLGLVESMGLNEILILVNYSGSVQKKLEFSSIIVEPNLSNSIHRASRIRVSRYYVLKFDIYIAL